MRAMMRIFFDTSVLVAASARNHPHHAQAWPALRRVALKQDQGFIGVHSIAETYAALTRLPVQPRIHPSDAGRIVRDNILEHFTLVPAGRDEYLEALNAVQDNGWPGAKIYDALLLACAARSGAERIYTFNLGDFKGLASPELQARIGSP
jgi:predicted nucleic acid-binding protein